jgi:hypothetical protein
VCPARPKRAPGAPNAAYSRQIMSQNHRRDAPAINPTKNSSLFEVPNKQAAQKYCGRQRTSRPATSRVPTVMARDSMRRECGGVWACSVLQPQQGNQLRYKTKRFTPLYAPHSKIQHRRSKRSSTSSRYSKKNKFLIPPSDVKLAPIMQTWQFTPYVQSRKTSSRS